MDEKFALLKNSASRASFRVLDLGSAPGSWSLYVMRTLMQKGYLKSSEGQVVVSVDLSALSRQHDQGLFDRADFHFIQGDFTLPAIREEIIALGPYNLILSDAAPATSGNRTLDSLRSLALGECALEYAVLSLAPGGKLVIKVFQGGGSDELLKAIRGRFSLGKSFKPQASRAESFETYYLGLTVLGQK